MRIAIYHQTCGKGTQTRYMGEEAPPPKSGPPEAAGYGAKSAKGLAIGARRRDDFSGSGSVTAASSRSESAKLEDG